ncbi:MAG: hypothetical protein J5879_00750 [Clostridia bacterium]|nr:hypothetical protein [Clostridia bacterium]
MIRVLFVGNSYTYYNDLPGLFVSECKNNGIEAEADSVTAGGYTLAHFLSEENEYGVRMRKLLEDNAYDYVVLQEQSVRPALQPDTFLKCAAALMPLIRENGAVPVFYETWARADGSDVLEKAGWNHDTMQSLLRASYEKAAEESGALIVYAGERIHEAYGRGEPVYDDDKSHPSPLGSLIAAKEFCRVLTAHHPAE